MNDSGTFIEREGQHFDDLNTADSPQLGFQVDWSFAPDWANYWIKTSGKSYAWLSDKPEISEIIPHWNIECIQKAFAPSFDYQGDWKDSLRKRPQEKPKQHQCNCAHWKGGSTFMGETHTCSDCGGWVMI